MTRGISPKRIAYILQIVLMDQLKLPLEGLRYETFVDQRVISHLFQNEKCHTGFRFGIFDREIPPKEVNTEEYEDSDEENDYQYDLPDIEY